ncbi:hypothetical protein [uncultured Gimesia sp.]|uniref:hypothetical protein n=1 Tax=uncultured Gimesia sp. TaxID=1678688 RepID=UPI0026356C36|nr:hypothetical protein [uncultured Gimesia sp.]
MNQEEYQRPQRREKRRSPAKKVEAEGATKSKTEKPKSKSKTKQKKKKDEELSTHKVIAMLMVAIGLFGWACFAAAYAHAEEGWRSNEAEKFAEENSDIESDDSRFGRRSRARSAMIITVFVAMKDFVLNAFRQIPNVFSVIAFNFQHRLWLVILFAVLEGGAVFLGYLMEKVGESFVDTPKY